MRPIQVSRRKIRHISSNNIFNDSINLPNLFYCKPEVMFNPVFIIKYIEHSNQGASNDSLEALYSESAINKVYDEIIAPSGELIYEKVDESKIMEEMDGLEKDLTALLLSNMFGISVGKSSENIIHLRLIL